jgi:hypothetical protein
MEQVYILATKSRQTSNFSDLRSLRRGLSCNANPRIDDMAWPIPAMLGFQQ